MELPAETKIIIGDIALIMGGENILSLQSPFSFRETVERLRAAACLIEMLDKEKGKIPPLAVVANAKMS